MSTIRHQIAARAAQQLTGARCVMQPVYVWDSRLRYKVTRTRVIDSFARQQKSLGAQACPNMVRPCRADQRSVPRQFPNGSMSSFPDRFRQRPVGSRLRRRMARLAPSNRVRRCTRSPCDWDPGGGLLGALHRQRTEHRPRQPDRRSQTDLPPMPSGERLPRSRSSSSGALRHLGWPLRKRKSRTTGCRIPAVPRTGQTAQ